MLGREAATLAEGVQDAGFKWVQWDAGGFAGGGLLLQMIVLH